MGFLYNALKAMLFQVTCKRMHLHNSRYHRNFMTARIGLKIDISSFGNTGDLKIVI